MNTRSFRHYVNLGLALLWISTAAELAGATNYYDQTFTLSDWEFTYTGSITSSYVDRILYGGTAYYRHNHIYLADTFAGYRGCNRWKVPSYDPHTLGAVASIAYSARVMALSNDHVRLAVFQNGVCYSANQTDFLVPNFNISYVTSYGPGMPSWTRESPSGPPNPDFSTSGSPLQVGYVTYKDGTGTTHDFYITQLSVTFNSVPMATVNGSVVLEDMVVAPTGQVVSVQLFSPGTSTLLGASSTTLTSSGTFTTTVLPNATGPYDIRIKSDHWLAKRISGVTESGGLYTVSTGLENGDVDGDNQVTIFDYSVLSTYFDKSVFDLDWNSFGANGYRPSDADLDEDGAVTIYDYLILSTNFDKIGDS